MGMCGASSAIWFNNFREAMSGYPFACKGYYVRKYQERAIKLTVNTSPLEPNVCHCGELFKDLKVA